MGQRQLWHQHTGMEEEREREREREREKNNHPQLPAGERERSTRAGTDSTSQSLNLAKKSRKERPAHGGDDAVDLGADGRFGATFGVGEGPASSSPPELFTVGEVARIRNTNTRSANGERIREGCNFEQAMAENRWSSR